MSEFYIDWDNLPKCGDQGIIISPYICVDDSWQPPIDNPPPTAVPLPGTLVLMALGLAVMRLVKR